MKKTINTPQTQLVMSLVLAMTILTTTAPAQSSTQQTTTRPRTVSTPPAQTQQQRTPAPATPARQQVTPAPRQVPPPTSALPPTGQSVPQAVSQSVTMTKFRARVAEAKRLFKTRPVPTAITSPSISFVTLAALDNNTSQIHLLTLPKSLFLSRGAEATITTSLGSTVHLRVLRANGVNTAVTVVDNAGKHLVPLVVEYPIERNGAMREMAYYTSAHPALLSPEVVKAGQSYVRTMLDLAARRLRDKGVFVNSKVIDMAEVLCVVEHTDHTRFRAENRRALFEEVYALYALNELDTYKFSVSTAGAGGMIQMIPSTYQMMRRLYPGIGLNPDFVLGMRNHGNALEAMLLYMPDVWNNLSSNPDISYALNAKIATMQELMAAGYNSNPAKLPAYIRRGGAAWRTLIPNETQMYLQIYRSFDSLIPVKPRG